MNIDRENKTVTIRQNTAINISLVLALTLASMLISAAVTFADLRNQVKLNETNVTELKNRTTKLEIEGTNTKVEFSKIQTQLLNIETNLIEIKEKL